MSVSWGTQYAKLKSNLRLASNRLKLLQKKKTEQAHKAQTEVAEFINADKEDRARIRVESIIREDFIVEAYELLEMYCELLLARFGLIQQMKELDDGIAEAVASLLWAAPRVSHEIPEFKIITEQLQQKYGKQYCEAARMNQLPEPSRVSPKLIQKLAVTAPSKLLVEKYLVEIAKCTGLDFTPDPKVMREDDSEVAIAERNLINFINEENIGWNVGPQQSVNPTPAPSEYSYAPPPPLYTPSMHGMPEANYQSSKPTNRQDMEKSHQDIVDGSSSSFSPHPNVPKPSDFVVPHVPDISSFAHNFPEPLTDIPSSNNIGQNEKNQQPNSSNDPLDFDALAKRFEELKKRI